jgi:hypothetical protein
MLHVEVGYDRSQGNPLQPRPTDRGKSRHRGSTWLSGRVWRDQLSACWILLIEAVYCHVWGFWWTAIPHQNSLGCPYLAAWLTVGFAQRPRSSWCGRRIAQLAVWVNLWGTSPRRKLGSQCSSM